MESTHRCEGHRLNEVGYRSRRLSGGNLSPGSELPGEKADKKAESSKSEKQHEQQSEVFQKLGFESGRTFPVVRDRHPVLTAFNNRLVC